VIFQVTGGDNLDSITATTYQNLTQDSWVVATNNLVDPNLVTAGQFLEIPVNCSCDNSASSDHYLFLTYVVLGGTGGNLSGIASDFNSSTELIKKFNPAVVWDNSQPTQYAFIPLPGTNSVALCISYSLLIAAGALVNSLQIFFHDWFVLILLTDQYGVYIDLCCNGASDNGLTLLLIS